MNRERVLVALSILVAVVVVGTVAAGLVDSSTATGEQAAGIGEENGSQFQSGNESGGIGVSGEVPAIPDLVPGWLLSGPLGALVLASVVVVATYVVYLLFAREFGRLIATVFKAISPVLLGVGLLVFALLVAALLVSDGGGGFMGSSQAPVDGGGGMDETSTSDLPAPPLLVVTVLAVLLVAAVGLLYRSRESETGPAPQSVDEPEAGDAGPSGGGPLRFDASDAPPANEVYRAWRTLADDVGATRTATPSEVRNAAIAAGYDADDVEELTELFRTVRYSDVPASARPERRARELSGHLSIDAA